MGNGFRACHSAKMNSKDTQILVLVALFFQKPNYVAKDPILAALSCTHACFCEHIGTTLPMILSKLDKKS